MLCASKLTVTWPHKSTGPAQRYDASFSKIVANAADIGDGSIFMMLSAFQDEKAGF